MTSEEIDMEVAKYEKIWIDGLNRGDVSAADKVFSLNCIIHMAGAPDPNLSSFWGPPHMAKKW